MAETSKAELRRIKEGFFKKYCTGKGIDIGCGRLQTYDGADPLLSGIYQHDSDICDAHTMEVFKNEEFDFVYASHILEHLQDPFLAIYHWFRICKTNGYVIITVPSAYRYEKKLDIPVSRWNADHKRAYLPATLLLEVQGALPPNTFLIEYYKDCAEGYNWSIHPNEHSGGEYQYELVLKKIAPPTWVL